MIELLPLRRNGQTVALCLLAVGAFTLLVTSRGIPVLRHDWNYPVWSATQAGAFRTYYEGWSRTGFGEVHAYPTAYLFGFALAIGSAILPPLGILIAVLVGIATAVFLYSWRLARELGGTRVAAAASGLFALYNPWVYTEIVAGHVTMIAAYAGTLGVIAELASRRDRPVVLAILAAVIALQIQFALLVDGFLFVRALMRRDCLVASSIVVWLAPSAVGIVASWGTVARTPYLTTWQFQQSIDPAKLLLFGGYFMGYAEALIDQGRPELWTIAALAAIGTVVAVIERRAATNVLIAAAVILLYTTGSKGPLKPLYEWLVVNVPESGVFRELFDLTAFGVILYLVAINCLARRNGIAGFVFLAATLGLCFTWISHAPNAFWPRSGELPELSSASVGHARFALFPAFQPLSFDGQGTGLDPDAFERDGAVPLNTSEPSFPVDVALARYELSGSTRDLRALGVDRIIERPRYRMDLTAASEVLAGGTSAVRRLDRPLVSQDLTPAPYVSTVDRVVISALANRVGHNVIFAGDLSRSEALRLGVAQLQTESIDPPRSGTDPSRDWVDARLSFAVDPDIGQAFGGAYTSSTLPLRVRSGDAALVFVRGRLESPGAHWFVGATNGYRWISIPKGIDSLRCRGTCAIAMQARVIPSVPLEPPTASSHAVPNDHRASWIVIAHVPTTHGPLLTLNERYHAAWLAISANPFSILPHLRIDTSANGWLLSRAGGTVYLVQLIAGFQLMLELAAAFWLVLLCMRVASKRVGTR